MVMKEFLVGIALLLSANGVLADSAAVEQSVKDMLVAAKERQLTSELLTPQATLGTGELLLRDAIYLYNVPTYAGFLHSLVGIGCDIFQLVLDVESGFTDLAIAEGVDSGGYFTIYPDRIYAEAAMFSYALYSQYPDKQFVFLDVDYYGEPNVNADPATIVGRATTFGYCFSTNPDAAVFSCDQQQCYSSSEVNPF